MNMEGTMKLTQEITDGAVELSKNLFERSTAYYSQCMSLAQTAQEKLATAKTPAALIELQKEYSKELWEATKENYQVSGEIMKESYARSSALMKEAYDGAKDMMTPEAPSAPAKTKPVKKTT